MARERPGAGDRHHTQIPIALTCADYARIMPLATGEVRAAGIALTMILGSRGSWPARAEMLRRAVQDPEVQGGEWSMAQYLYAIDRGDRRLVGLPVFPLRNFPARDLYVRRGGPVREPADLAGRRIGMYSYSASGSTWYRHFLRFVGLDPEAIQWYPYEFDADRAQIEMFCGGAHRLGLTKRRIAVEEYFAEYLSSGGAEASAG